MVSVALVTLGPGFFFTEKYGSPIPAALGALVFIVPMAYLSVGLGFVFPLILDRHISWQEAMRTALSTVHRQWFAVAGLVLIYTLMAVAGVFACCVGIVFTISTLLLSTGKWIGFKEKTRKSTADLPR